MECAQNGSLESYYDDYINRFKDKEHFLPLDEKLIIKIFKQLLNGVNYLHSKGVIHGNIKTNNILLDEKNNIKISYFDISALFKGNNGDKDEDKKKDEIKKFEKYDSKVDIYKIGLAMLYIMSYENPIIKDDKNNEYVDKKAINECYNIYLKKLVLRMLNEDKNLRPNGKEILDEIALIEFYQNNPINLLIKNFLDERNEPKIKEIKKSKNVQINNINNQHNYNQSLNNSPNNNNNFQNHYTFNNNQNINNGYYKNNHYESQNQFATQ
jgi:serine/threonine protein kinase